MSSLSSAIAATKEPRPDWKPQLWNGLVTSFNSPKKYWKWHIDHGVMPTDFTRGEWLPTHSWDTDPVAAAMLRAEMKDAGGAVILTNQNPVCDCLFYIPGCDDWMWHCDGATEEEATARAWCAWKGVSIDE